MSLLQHLKANLPISHHAIDDDKNELYTDYKRVENDEIEKLVSDYFKNQNLKTVNVTAELLGSNRLSSAIVLDICEEDKPIKRLNFTNSSGRRQMGPSWILFSEYPIQ
jgi:hypothetical protein